MTLLNGIPFLGGITLIQNGRFFDGSAAAPSISFFSEPGLGFYRYGTGTIGFGAAGSMGLLFQNGGVIYGASANNKLTMPGNGSITLEAGGTNQNITLIPVGTGVTTLVCAPGYQYSTRLVTSDFVIGVAGTSLTLGFGAVSGNTYAQVQVGSVGGSVVANLILNASGGNILFATNTDSANGRIQLATHTTAGGGIGFGTDVTLYRSAADALTTDDSFFASGSIKSYSSVLGIGYATGAGGTVVQATSKVTAFTLSKVCGSIQFAADALGADTTTAGATWTNTAIAAGDVIAWHHKSGGTLGAYNFVFTCAAGSANVKIRNLTPGSLSEAPVIQFAVIKAVTA